MTQMQMEGQVAVVTGGAGGIGTGIAQCLAAQGARVVITGRRDQAALDAAAAALPGDGHWGYCVAVDDTPGMERFAAAIEARYGRLDVLVNNAGITKWVAHDDLDGLDDELIDTVFRVNWRGPFVGIRVFRKLLEAGSGGVVINISSGSGTSGFGSNVAYCAAKAGINMMTRSLARALAPKVRVPRRGTGIRRYRLRQQGSVLGRQQGEELPAARPYPADRHRKCRGRRLHATAHDDRRDHPRRRRRILDPPLSETPETRREPWFSRRVSSCIPSPSATPLFVNC